MYIYIYVFKNINIHIYIYIRKHKKMFQTTNQFLYLYPQTYPNKKGIPQEEWHPTSRIPPVFSRGAKNHEKRHLPVVPSGKPTCITIWVNYNHSLT